MQDSDAPAEARAGTVLEVFAAFLMLGLTAFGGPVAHLGYFRDAFVVRRRWLGEAAYADLVALCQVLPGPTSSQVGFAIGLGRAGFPGALAAFLAFTLPSAAILVFFALGAEELGGAAAGGLLHGLKVVAVPVVAAAVLGMARSLTPDVPRAAIALAVFALLLVWRHPAAYPAAIAAGALAGLALPRTAAAPLSGGASRGLGVSKGVAFAALALFCALLFGPLVRALLGGTSEPGLFAGMFRAGALVFGGGHVVLPLLESVVVRPGGIDAGRFLAGYAAAQAVPGPLFSFAGYLGALSGLPGHVASALTGMPDNVASALLGAAIALAAIFLPGFLILLAALPFHAALMRRAGARAAVAGANAGVVGLLAAAFWNPVASSAIGSRLDLALAAAGFVLLVPLKAPPLVVVLASALAGLVLSSV